MTCIVGLEAADGSVWMGGDSAAADGWEVRGTRLAKVFKRPPFLIGYTTSFRMGQLLQYKLELPARPAGMDYLEFMATEFVDAVRTCLKEGGFATIDNNQEEGGAFLVGYKGNLYEICSDFQVNRTWDEFAAVGCGATYALGSFYMTQGWEGPAGRIHKALEAADYFSGGVRRPFIVENISNE